MAESFIHRRLVDQMYRWVAHNWFEGDRSQIRVDDGKVETGVRPPVIEGHVPDLFALLPESRGVIVGEAKTPSDLETERSVRQIEGFLRYCSGWPESCVVLAVPWTHEPTARRLLAVLKRREGLESVDSMVMRQLDALTLECDNG